MRVENLSLSLQMFDSTCLISTTVICDLTCDGRDLRLACDLHISDFGTIVMMGIRSALKDAVFLLCCCVTRVENCTHIADNKRELSLVTSWCGLCCLTCYVTFSYLSTKLRFDPLRFLVNVTSLHCKSKIHTTCPYLSV